MMLFLTGILYFILIFVVEKLLINQKIQRLAAG